MVPEWEQLKMHVHHLEGSLSPLNHQKLKQQGDRTRREELQEVGELLGLTTTQGLLPSGKVSKALSAQCQRRH